MGERTRRRVGIVGAGLISRHHIEALRSIDGVEIVGVCDTAPHRARAVAAELEVDALPSLSALADAGAEVIHVLTPSESHAELTLEAIERGCHVFVEKPLAEDVEDCRRIQRAAAERRVHVCVGHSLLFEPEVRRALRMVERGRLGKVVGVEVTRSSAYEPYRGGALPPPYRRAGHPFRDLGLHGIYLVRTFLGPIERVDGQWASLGGDPNLAFDEWRALVHARRGLGQVALSWSSRPLGSELRVVGTKGVLRIDLFARVTSFRPALPLPKALERTAGVLLDSIQHLAELPQSAWAYARGRLEPFQGVRDLVRAFYRALDRGEPMPVPLEGAIEAVHWTEQVARAAEREHRAAVSRWSVSNEVPYLVTGASGALGSAIVQRLRQRGDRVRCFVRRPSADLPEGVEVVVGDLGDPDAVSRAVRGARRVIHAGAATTGGPAQHECATIVGTRNVIDACVEHRVEKLVHVSSMSVVHWARGEDGATVSEQTPLEPNPELRGDYTRAKLEAERLVRRAVEERKLAAVILRPGQIFGGRLPLLTPAVARRLSDRWLLLGDGQVRLPLVYLEDVVDAVLMASDGDLKRGEIVQLTDPEALTQNELIQKVVGDESQVIRIPRALLFAGGKLSEPLFELLLKRHSPVSEYRLRSALAKRDYRSLHAEQLLGWRPRVGVRAGIRRTLGAGE